MLAGLRSRWMAPCRCGDAVMVTHWWCSDDQQRRWTRAHAAARRWRVAAHSSDAGHARMRSACRSASLRRARLAAGAPSAPHRPTCEWMCDRPARMPRSTSQASASSMPPPSSTWQDRVAAQRSSRQQQRRASAGGQAGRRCAPAPASVGKTPSVHASISHMPATCQQQQQASALCVSEHMHAGAT